LTEISEPVASNSRLESARHTLLVGSNLAKIMKRISGGRASNPAGFVVKTDSWMVRGTFSGSKSGNAAFQSIIATLKVNTMSPGKINRCVLATR